VAGGYAYIAQGNASGYGFASVDISDPDTTFLVDVVLHPGYGVNVALRGNYAYVAADNNGGLFTINISNPANMILAGTSWTGETYGIVWAGDHAYAVVQNQLRVLSFPDSVNAVIIGSCDGQAFCRNLTVRDNFAYVVGGGLEIFDISDTTAPVSVSFTPLPGFARDIVLWSNFAYIAADTAGLRVFDISNPSAPVEVGYYNTPGKAWGLTADENIIYLADSSRFGVYEFYGAPFIRVTSPNGGESWACQEPHAITWTSSGVWGNVTLLINRHYPNGLWDLIEEQAPNTGSYDWMVSGPVAEECRIKIVSADSISIGDTSDADFAAIRGCLDLHPNVLAFGLVPVDSTAFNEFWVVNCGTDTLFVDSMCSDNPVFWDVTDFPAIIAPAESAEVGMAFQPLEGREYVGHFTVYSSAGDSSVLLTGTGWEWGAATSPTALPTEFALLPVYPNPFNASATISFSVPRASQVAIRAYDVLGREAATIADREFGAGWQQVSWSCDFCASGMYVIVMTASGTRCSQKALLMR
jgi:hypothetical protein